MTEEHNIIVNCDHSSILIYTYSYTPLLKRGATYLVHHTRIYGHHNRGS